MPELPEVQTVVSDLREKIIGDTIVDFWSDAPGAIKGKTYAQFRRVIKNKRILGVRRWGKNIFIDLSEGKTLYIHLKMTGHLLVKTPANFQFSIFNFSARGGSAFGGQSISKSPISKKNLERDPFGEKVNAYVHHAWKLKNKKGELESMEFSDMRKFARIMLDDTEKVQEMVKKSGLGIDAMDTKFTFQYFEKLLEKKSQTPIGIFLLDQNSIAGIGNIYRSEILFDAGVRGERKAGSLSQKEKKKIFASTKDILKKAIKMRGTSYSDYRDTQGKRGKFQEALKVYRRAGEKCLKCGTIILRKTMGQRSYFYCPKCQE